MPTLNLPTKDRGFAPYTTGEPIEFPSPAATKGFNRVAYAAAHVVADPLADIDPWLDTTIDWERTIAFRHYLWDLGLGVAEAMDTAQRGGGLDWLGAKELIRRALAAAKSRPGVEDLLRRRHRSSRCRAPMSASTTSCAPMKSRSRRSKRWADGSSSWRAARSPRAAKSPDEYAARLRPHPAARCSSR